MKVIRYHIPETMADVPRSMKAPPVYEEGNSYEEYKKDLKIWQLLKVATEEQEGPLVYITFKPKSKAKAACSDLSADEIGSKNGLKLILERLDSVFLTEENQRIFTDLDQFERFKRSPNMTMSAFILSFENLHNKVKSHKCTYPDGVLAYRLLKASNVSNDHEQLIKATVATGAFTYKAVVDQLKKVFSEIPSVSASPAIKVESTYHAVDVPTMNHQAYEECENHDQLLHENGEEFEETPDLSLPPVTNDIYYGNRFNPSSRFRGGSYRSNNYSKPFTPRKSTFQTPTGYQRLGSNSRFVDSRPPTSSEYTSLKEQYSSDPSTTNPKDKKGNHTICRRCRSIYHWIVDCPHNSTEDNSKDSYFTRSPEEEIYIALLQSCAPKSQDEITGLVAETLSKGVIDSGCTKTVAGERWFNDYLQTLSNEEVQNIQYCGSNAQFRFGDSPPVQSKKKALLPMVMGNKNIQLSTDIVPTDVPLLLSKQTMKTALKISENRKFLFVA